MGKDDPVEITIRSEADFAAIGPRVERLIVENPSIARAIVMGRDKTGMVLVGPLGPPSADGRGDQQRRPSTPNEPSRLAHIRSEDPAGRAAEPHGPGVPMSEWGTKRICPSCGTRYYDFNKALGEVACPKCGTQFDPEAFLKTRRRTAAPVEKEVVPVVAEEADAESVSDASETTTSIGKGEAGDTRESSRPAPIPARSILSRARKAWGLGSLLLGLIAVVFFIEFLHGNDPSRPIVSFPPGPPTPSPTPPSLTWPLIVLSALSMAFILALVFMFRAPKLATGNMKVHLEWKVTSYAQGKLILERKVPASTGRKASGA